jgi:hypothetical protein
VGQEVIALACIALGLAVASTAGLIAFAWRADKRATAFIDARDLFQNERWRADAMTSERDIEVAAHAVTAKQLKDERDLRAAIEAERNDAYRIARDYYAARIESANVADASRIVSELLALPLPRVVSGALPKADAPTPGPDDLERP